MDNEPLKILIVDDDEDDAFFIQDLIFDGITHPRPIVEHCLSAHDALLKLEGTPYGLCLFDYRLGDVDGIDLLRTTRSRGIGIPIVLLTGQGDQEVAVEAMKAGATDYLTKGKLTVESLTHSIRYALELTKEAMRRRQAEEMLKRSHEDLKKAHKELQLSMAQLQSAQNQILRSEKLAGIGRLAAGVCHEILNPLNIISGHSQALMLEREDDTALQEDLESVMEEIHRIEKIISGLLKFSRKGDVELHSIDVNKEVESVLSILEKEMLIDGIRVERHLLPGMPLLLLDGDRMRQVFLNIINNARYAMPRGGTLTVTTEILNHGSKVSDARSENASGSESRKLLRIKFTDTGYGIKQEDMEKLFDPFFTTKPEDKGTGLGLSVCFTIVEKHGGTIDVESEYGKGATFIIDLPAHRGTGNDLHPS